MKINQTSVRRINWMWTLDGFEQFCQELPGSSSGLFISHHRFEKWIVINFLSKCQDALKDAQRILWHNVYNTSFSTLEQLFLCEQEIDQLCEEWTPEPLHPPITEEMEKEPPVLERWELLIVLNLTQNCGLRRWTKEAHVQHSKMTRMVFTALVLDSCHCHFWASHLLWSEWFFVGAIWHKVFC